MEINKEIGARLKESRVYAGLSQRQVAELLGILQPAYARYESGKIELDYHKLIELCKIYDVSADYILGLRGYDGEKLY